jgi:hypothetical protein
LETGIFSDECKIRPLQKGMHPCLLVLQTPFFEAMKRSVIGLLLVWWALGLLGQSVMPRQTGLYVGWYQHVPSYSDNINGPDLPIWHTRFRVPTISLERTLRRYGSFRFGVGGSSYKHDHAPVESQTRSHASMEFRYYFLFRRHMPSSGFYIGLIADLNHVEWNSSGNKGKGARTSWQDGGLSLGYQHAWGGHWRFDEGLTSMIRSNVHTESYDVQNNVYVDQIVVDAWYAIYFYVRVGFLSRIR